MTNAQPAAEWKTFGERIASLRKVQGYSQVEFGRRVERGETWVSQVERGVRRIDSASMIERLADALDVPTDELMAAWPALPDLKTASRGAASALAMVFASNQPLKLAVDELVTVDIDDIEARTVRAWDYTHGSQYEELAGLLSDLLADVELAERKAEDEAILERARRAKARSCLAAAGALSKLGDHAAAWAATERALTAAEALGDLAMMAECSFRLAITFQGGGRLDLAAHSARQALSHRAARPDVELAELSLYGALGLQLAVIAARGDDPDRAYGYLEEARRAGERTGDRNDYNTEFGPTNVLLHEVAIAVEVGDAGRALRVADRVDASRLSAERQARLLVDVARAHAQRRHADGVVAALTRGAAIAPQQYASHPRVRELVSDLLRGPHGRRADVRNLAAHIRMTA
jgi:transcriptional regulator with XRE-family HTH domain